MVVLQSRGDDVTDVTVNLRVIPVVTLWNGHITGEPVNRSYLLQDICRELSQEFKYQRKTRWLARNEEALALRKHAAVRH